jgi:hypothetical protein
MWLGWCSILSILLIGGITQAQQWRLPDDRPQLNVTELENAGLHILRSKRLILVTDVEPDLVRNFPPLADSLFEELEKQLGPLRPDVAGTEFQVTGYLINARERFADLNLLPPEQYPVRHGRHIGYQFWMNNQTSPYYRRHLLLHEFVHCFMSCEFGMRDIPPLWYTEGIAEYFATHQLSEESSQSRFGVLPSTVSGYEGWGRIDIIRQSLKDHSEETGRRTQFQPLDRVLHPPDNIFLEDQQYANAWALVWLIRNHPQLKPHFRELWPVRSYQQYVDVERSVPAEIWKRMAIVWPLFLDSVTEGFDLARSFPELQPEIFPLSNGDQGTRTAVIAADREWQFAGRAYVAGQSVKLTCEGRYQVHDVPRPWISEPQGVTIEYVHERPLGEVSAIIVSADGKTVSRRIAAGTGVDLTFADDSELWLQINDSAASRSGNSGSVEVFIEQR